MIESAFAYFLNNLIPLRALVGERIYQRFARQRDVPPYLTYYRTETRTHTLQGPDRRPVARFSLQAFADDTLARSVRQAVRDGIDGLTDQAGNVGRGWMGAGGVRVFVQSARLEDSQDDYEPPAHADDAGQPHQSMTVVLVYEDS